GTLLISATSGFSNCSLPLLAVGGQQHGGANSTPLTQAELASVIDEALARWRASGISASDQARLAAVSFSLADLEPGHLGGESGSTVLIDRDAAGWGWYIDPTPADDAEFTAAGGDLRAGKGSPAEGRMDLLTVVMHELGHVLGYDDLPVASHPNDLMAENIPTGVRRVPGGLAHVSSQVTGAAPQAASFPLTIGTLPAGKSVTITFDVTINSSLPSSVTQVVNQGSISGSNFANVLTDDPGTAAPADATITPLDVVTTFRVYLPTVAQGNAPDLVVTDISLTPNKTTFAAGEPVEVRVTVKNQGSASAGPFWVDLYINPSSPPTAANQVWNNRCGLAPCFGMAWQVTSELAPGQSVTLSSQSLPAGYSNWRGYFAAGTSDVYVYADSFNPGVVAGAVAESSETNNRAELHGLRVTGPNPKLSGPTIADLRQRP
ncbi:MAG TPA: CARDB domain-containing protein, partial [Roseiflexaceae bacterium]|nr:CARDB domain-containing protein [Roseiflexaceae bacterium]